VTRAATMALVAVFALATVACDASAVERERDRAVSERDSAEADRARIALELRDARAALASAEAEVRDRDARIDALERERDQWEDTTAAMVDPACAATRRADGSCISLDDLLERWNAPAPVTSAAAGDSGWYACLAAIGTPRFGAACEPIIPDLLRLMPLLLF